MVKTLAVSSHGSEEVLKVHAPFGAWAASSCRSCAAVRRVQALRRTPLYRATNHKPHSMIGVYPVPLFDTRLMPISCGLTQRGQTAVSQAMSKGTIPWAGGI